MEAKEMQGKSDGKKARVDAMAPKFHQNFFTIANDEEVDDIPEMITTVRDPHNHYIEVEATEEHSQRETRKVKELTPKKADRTSPLPFIKVDLNRNFDIDWKGMLMKVEDTDPIDLLKAKEDKEVDDPCRVPAVRSPHDLTSPVVIATGVPDHSVYHGHLISDIPTSYAVPRLAPHELPVVGTFVDPLVLPGFAYRVRLNGSNEYLFDGEALVLESIGQGYGKRLSFESQDILYGKNYFWSDSNPEEGYGFSLSLHLEDNKFEIRDGMGSWLGNVEVTKVEDEQVITKKRFYKNNVEIHVEVKLLCKLQLVSDVERELEIPLEGVAIATKHTDKSRACVYQVQDIEIPGCGMCSFEKSC